MAYRFLTPFKALLIGAAIAAGSVGVSPSMAKEGETERSGGALRVTLDRAKVLRTEESAKTVIIGNPLIIDATVQDSRTIVLTGRSFGVTNLIILNALGEPILDENVVVGAQETNTVRIYRRSSRETLACSPVCEPTITVGDNDALFKDLTSQVQSRNALSQPGR